MRAPIEVITLIYIAFFLSLVPPLVGVLLTSWLRARRRRRVHRHQVAERKITPLLIQALAEDAAEDGSIRVPSQLIHFSRRMGTELELLITPLIASLRGAERARLTAILEHNGNMHRAVRRSHSWQARHRLAAVEFLGAVGSPKHSEILLARLHDRNHTVRGAAVRALGRVGAHTAVPVMLNRLTSDRLPAVAPHTVAMSVLRCGTGAVPALVDSMNHPHPHVRRTSVDLLGWLGAAEAAAGLTRIAESGIQPGAACAVEALDRIGIPYQAA